ncbi:conserved protein of unknown function [Tenacibaculum sp. 190524A02b]|uniref:hypothetical protein n=1 Tax=Tenacibaculum vairaonense TaxID=3137860 RepID=UPI0032B19694
MKRVLFLLVTVFGLTILTGCTDNSLEELKENEIQSKIKIIEPKENGDIDEEDFTED